MLRDGVEVEYRREDGSIRRRPGAADRFRRPDSNDWLAVNQFTVIEGQHNRRPDIVVFVNGLPLGVIELKNAADEDATIWDAWNQLQTYKQEIPSLFHYNEALVDLGRAAGPDRLADGQPGMVQGLAHDRRAKRWPRRPFSNWKSWSVAYSTEERFLKLLRHFIVFEEDTDSDQVYKILAGYHQFHAVQKAMDAIVEAVAARRATGAAAWSGTRRARGKSLTMLFYAGQIILHPAMDNPTHRRPDRPQRPGRPAFRPVPAVPRTAAATAGAGRSRRPTCASCCRWPPAAWSSPPSRNSCPTRRASRMPLLSERRNIVVIADEAHRSQYDLIDGLRPQHAGRPAQRLVHRLHRHAHRKDDANTRAVFGDYISHLRHPAGGGGQGDGADLLREPASPSWR